MTARLPAVFLEQARACAALGSPFMAQLCTLLADRLRPGTPLTDRLFNWPGDIGPGGDSLPLRLCGALHALRLRGHEGLARVYPPAPATDDALWDEVAQALTTEATFLDRFIDSPPQTNEVRRSAALIAAAHVIGERFPLPSRISELGASAGLNLNWDRFALDASGTRLGPGDAVLTLSPEWSGPPPRQAQITVAERRGVDLNPVTDATRLRAYLWPDQPERMALTEAALSVPPAPVDQGDAVDWLERRLAHIPGQLHMTYTTIAWQYFPKPAQERGLSLIETAGACATGDHPLAFVQMENDGGENGAALTVRLWPGDLLLHLGRVDFHGRWVNWQG